MISSVLEILPKIVPIDKVFGAKNEAQSFSNICFRLTVISDQNPKN